MPQSKDKWLNSPSPHCEQAQGVFGDVITGLETGLDHAGGVFLSGTHLHHIRRDERVQDREIKLFTQESLISKSMLERAAHGFVQDILTVRLQDPAVCDLRKVF